MSNSNSNMSETDDKQNFNRKKPKNSTERSRKYRNRLKAARLQEELEKRLQATVSSLILEEAGDSPTPPSETSESVKDLKRSKTSTERVRKYRARKRDGISARSLPPTKRPKTGAERVWEYRERKKAARLREEEECFKATVRSLLLEEDANLPNKPTKNDMEEAGDSPTPRSEVSESLKRPKTSTELVWKYRARMKARRLREEEECFKATVRSLLLEEAANIPPSPAEEEQSAMTINAATTTPNKPTKNDMVEQWKLRNLRDAYRAKMQRVGCSKEYIETSATYDISIDIPSNEYKIKIEAKDEDSNGSHDINEPPDNYSMCEIKLEPYQFSDDVVHAAREGIEAPSSTTTSIATLGKSSNRADNQVQFLETLQREGQSLLQSTHMDVSHESSISRVTDSDYTFLLSFLPHMKRMSELQNLQFRAKMSDLLLNTLNPPQTSVVPTKILQKRLTTGDSISDLMGSSNDMGE